VTFNGSYKSSTIIFSSGSISLRLNFSKLNAFKENSENIIIKKKVMFDEVMFLIIYSISLKIKF